MLQRQPSPGARADAISDGDGWSAAALATAAAIAAMVVVRALVAANTGLTDDEAYYRLWALAPALSYLDHPPMAGWWIAAGRWIAGDTALGVRLMQLVAFVIGTAALWRGAQLLFSETVALTTVWLTLAMPLMAAGGIVITPDGPTVLCWALTFWAMAELVRSENPNWWLAVGVFAGTGLLSKYTNLFLGAGLVLFLIAVPSQRRWFASWQLWAGGAIAVLCAVPVLMWNAEHEWASFAKQFGRVARGGDFGGKYLAELLGGFVGLASPLIAGLAIGGLIQLVRRVTGRHPVGETLVLALLVPALAYFLSHALHARVQANWLAPLYPLLAIAAALALATMPTTIWRRLTTGLAVVIGLLMSGLLYAHTLTPIDGGLARKDPTDQMRGWPAFAAEVERMRREAGAAWIATSSYATTGQLAFAFKDGAPVLQLDEPLRYVHLPAPPSSLTSQPALYVELERRQAPELLSRRFRSVTRLDDLVRRNGSEALARYAVYRIADP